MRQGSRKQKDADLVLKFLAAPNPKRHNAILYATTFKPKDLCSFNNK